MDERLHELLEECASIVRKSFPDYTDFDLHCCNDGYRSIMITKWENTEEKEVEQLKRRELFRQVKLSNDWGSDESPITNEYYEGLGLLLPE